MAFLPEIGEYFGIVLHCVVEWETIVVLPPEAKLSCLETTLCKFTKCIRDSLNPSRNPLQFVTVGWVTDMYTEEKNGTVELSFCDALDFPVIRDHSIQRDDRKPADQI